MVLYGVKIIHSTEVVWWEDPIIFQPWYVYSAPMLGLKFWNFILIHNPIEKVPSAIRRKVLVLMTVHNNIMG